MLIPQIFLISLIVAEALIYAQRRMRGVFAFISASILVIVFCAYGFYFDTAEFAREGRILKLIIGGLIIYGVPIYLFYLVGWLLRKRDEINHHIAAVLFASFNALVFPIFALITVCTLGIDCV